MKGLLVSIVLLGVILYGLIRPDQFAEVFNSFTLSKDYFLSLISKNTRQLGVD